MLACTANCSGGSKDQSAVFKIAESLAALCSPKAWARLLNGEAIGFIEPDANRWSLYINGSHVKTYTAPNLMAALRKVYKQHAELNDWVLMPGHEAAETRVGGPVFAELVNGYPNIMCLEPKALEIFHDKGTQPEQQAAEMRRRLDLQMRNLHREKDKRNVRAIDILGSQIHIHGMTREGRD